jgi:hypothetical protein
VEYVKSKSHGAAYFQSLLGEIPEQLGEELPESLLRLLKLNLQSVLVEAAQLARLFNPQLKRVHEKELQRGNKNRATLAVARRLVAYLMAVDKSGKP